MTRLGIATLVIASLFAARTADAFCGFYVAGSDQPMFNDATQVVLMRHGTRTVLSMQNNYKGPPTDFAMVIPVPTVLHEEDVKTLPKDVFDAVEKLGAPRLVEYWEQDPCYAESDDVDLASLEDTSLKSTSSSQDDPPDLGVKVEAKFVVGEYQIVVLSAKDSTGLDTWLRQEKYNIPAGAEPLLRPYVESGMKFFVAKVDPKKMKFEGGRAALSPLRFHYDSDQFNLPIRLGLANSSGKQDLIVNILAPKQRYEVANYKNVTIPTNLDVDERMKDKFASFYTALFDATIEKNPGAVVTEYAWQAMWCDPCATQALDEGQLAILGMDVLGEGVDPRDMVLTRLHARYGKDITNDLELKTAKPIVGGREEVVDESGKLEKGARPDPRNAFQGRYAIRHPWPYPIMCFKPVRGRWGGPWDEKQQESTSVATNLAFASRGDVTLPAALKEDVPELGVKAASILTLTPKKSGCGCQSTTPAADAGFGAIVLGLVVLPRRRRRRRHAA